ncbi:MAG TPA: cupredoxin family copper-binding protein [Coriobacteriia bacterium]
MRRIAIVMLVAALAALALTGCSSGATSGGTPGAATGGAGGASAAVEISGFAFAPGSVQVAVGGTVTWTNKDSAAHTVKGDGWGSGDLAQGATFSNTFDKAGTYAYSCGIHPSMTGDVVVK